MAAGALNRLGLYVHLPFCATKCAYCDFPSFAGKMGIRERYTAAVCAEIRLRAAQAGHPPADTVYLGGGTPSLMKPGQIGAILGALRESFPLPDGSEISCEANPGALSAAFLDAAAEGGVNRLSIGAQSSEPGVLAALGRRHSWLQVRQAVRLARAAGIENVSLDLLLGVPGQTLGGFEQTLDEALDLAPRHLSCYGLILEEGTPLKEAVDGGSLRLPGEEEEGAMYDLALRKLRDAGLEQYEVSNFARPGFECRHNVGCWTRAPYLGFGAAAHSLEESGRRRSNPADPEGYLRGETPAYEEIGREEAMFESVMLALRMNRGLSESEFFRAHGVAFMDRYGEAARRAAAAGLAETGEGRFRLTRRGMDVMNAVLVGFLPEKQPAGPGNKGP